MDIREGSFLLLTLGGETRTGTLRKCSPGQQSLVIELDEPLVGEFMDFNYLELVMGKDGKYRVPDTKIVIEVATPAQA